MNELHPDKVLKGPAIEPPAIAVCEHYAGTEKFLTKALELKTLHGAALDITCDCEDGAEFGSLKTQVDMLLGVLTSERFREHRVGIRLPDPGRREFRKELKRVMATLRGRLEYLTLPKLKNAKDVSRLLRAIQKLERTVRRRDELAIHVLIETPSALAEVRTIARMRRVRVLDFGIMDFISSLGGVIGLENLRSPAQFQHPLLVRAKTDIVFAASERGRIPSHNISLELKDESVVRDEARRARRDFGFRRMWSIHPMQVRPIIEEMSANSAELELAATILIKAQAVKWAPVRHEDTLYDRASYRLLWWQLKQARFLNSPIDESAKAAFFSKL